VTIQNTGLHVHHCQNNIHYLLTELHKLIHVLISNVLHSMIFVIYTIFFSINCI